MTKTKEFLERIDMINRAVYASSKEEKFETPQYLFDQLHQEFNFTLDPCCQHASAKCDKYYTPEEDGLIQNWTNEVAFVNPPYGRELKKWVKKSYEEWKKGATVVMLIPSRTDTRWFHDYIYGQAEIRFLKGRIRFKNPVTKQIEKHNAPFPSMVVVYENRSAEFTEK